MALNKVKLVQDLSDLYDTTVSGDLNEQQSKEAFVQGLANIIDGYIKTLKVNYTGGLSAVNGAVLGNINHTIS